MGSVDSSNTIVSLVTSWLFIGIALVLGYFSWCFNYWNKRNVKTLSPSIPFGNIGNPVSRKKAFYESVAEVYNKFKGEPYAGFYSLTQPYFVPIDNELIKNILIRDFPSFVNRGLYYNEESDPLSANLFFIGDNKWRNLRQKLTSTFTSGKMNKMFSILVECSKHLVDKLENGCHDDVREVLACYSTEVIGSCAFGLDCGSLQDPNVEFRRYTRKLFEYSPWKTLQRLAQIMAPRVCRFLGVRFVPKDVSDFFMQAVEDTVEMRKAKGIKRNDFLELLLELEQQGLLDKKDFAAQSFVFFVAGFETSSTTLTYLLFELSKDMSMQEECRKEIMETIDDGEMTYEQVMGMKFLDQLVEETLRLYPVLPFLNRECTEDYQVNDNLTLKKGTKLIIPTLAIHLDKEYFPMPSFFSPNRFSPENRTAIQSCTYMPFGEGPRKCIGNRFGLMQVKVGLVAIISKYRVTKSSVMSDELKWDTNGFTLKAKKGIYLDFEKL